LVSILRSLPSIARISSAYSSIKRGATSVRDLSSSISRVSCRGCSSSPFIAQHPRGAALGSRIAEVHNGSSLFTGDAGQGESNIRRYIVENDWLEAIIALLSLS
jgi:hypothetical protein